MRHLLYPQRVFTVIDAEQAHVFAVLITDEHGQRHMQWTGNGGELGEPAVFDSAIDAARWATENRAEDVAAERVVISPIKRETSFTYYLPPSTWSR